MVKKYFTFVALVVALLSLDGCIVFARRIFTYKLLPTGQVELKIDYIDIGSADISEKQETDTGFIEHDDETALSQAQQDYNSLIQTYYVSDFFSSCFPSGKVKRKRLYEANGKLNGEVIVTFDNLKAAGFYKEKNKLVLRTDSLCGFLPYIDSIVMPADSKLYNDTTTGENITYYTLKWPKKSTEWIIETVQYYPFVNESLLELWKKDQ